MSEAFCAVRDMCTRVKYEPEKTQNKQPSLAGWLHFCLLLSLVTFLMLRARDSKQPEHSGAIL